MWVVAVCDRGPVTTSISRKVIPGREADYEAWVQGITAQALTFSGHMGVNVIRPTPPSSEYVSIFRFDTYTHSRDWEESAIRAEWLARLEGITEGEDLVEKGTGLEFWFSLPELPAAHPSPHKMALVLLMTYLVMPRVTRLLKSWLYRDMVKVKLERTLEMYGAILRYQHPQYPIADSPGREGHGAGAGLAGR